MELEFEQYLPEIRELLARDEHEALRRTLDSMRIQDIAHVLMALEDDAVERVFNALARGRKVDVFSYLDPHHQHALLDRIAQADARHILSEMLPDDLTALLEDLPRDEVRRLLRLLPFRAIRRALTLLDYPDNSVGRLMTPEFVAVAADWSIQDSLDFIRVQKARGEMANVIFVIDDERRLLTSIPLGRFVMGRADEPVSSLGTEPMITLSVNADRAEAVRLIQHYDLEVLPVTDDDGVLLGIVTVDDVMDVVKEETTEDFHKLGSVGALNLSLRDARPSLLYRKRIGWLLVLVFLNMFGGIAIASFEDTISAVVVLVFFLPLIIASGGNAGAQASTLMVRAMATGDVKSSDWFRLWGKELLVATSLGLTMGIAVSAVGLWRGGPEIALLVAMAMAMVVVVGSMVGMILPFILSLARLDPATASAPLVTSVADVAGILIYFSLAVAILNLPAAGGGL
ncbi:magnesium transporter [Ectothiorhodospira shaposhnikovii]|uniref:magnesium transporter n=1 Tax=Ectothiorhodospira shaposhnikovii TaxID=1054 RepID=UPI001EE7E82F|nr:magnesium transporter [Ectothiorhodospira shaposhnikovii]MCG5512912.1 magnesium transporter [Ectothiorhodospira shaposhnikovii]